ARANPVLVIKGGVLEGKLITADEIKKLADLESREVLLAKMAGVMKAPLMNAVSLLNAPLAQTARLVEALRQQAEARTSAEASDSKAEARTSAEASDSKAEARTSAEASEKVETDQNEG
ncbi:MAG: 50S ribosomal protein L10, partial [Acidimicrobiales bacterium]